MVFYLKVFSLIFLYNIFFASILEKLLQPQYQAAFVSFCMYGVAAFKREFRVASRTYEYCFSCAYCNPA